MAEIDRRSVLRSGGAALAATLSAALPAQAPGVNRITVSAAPAQEFAGFGLSQPRGDDTFAAIDPALQSRALDLVYGALPVRFFRAWVVSGAAWDVARMVGDFELSYLDNGMLAKIAARCRPRLILAPGTQNKGPTIPAQDYAQKLAEFLARLRSEKGVVFEATGILNEPLIYPDSYLVEAAVALRRELDRRGLQGTEIIAGDWANADKGALKALAALEANAAANAAIHAWSVHSYNMASTRSMALASRNKERWVTEAGQGVGDAEGGVASANAMDAATVAGRFLADLNLGATRWIYFIGLLSDALRLAPGSSRQALVTVSNSRGLLIYNRYHYLKQLLAAFPAGSVVHGCSSSSEGAMEWTYGAKPPLVAACAQGPDARVRLAAVNTTGIVGSAITSYRAARDIGVAFDLPWAGKRFRAVVTGADAVSRDLGLVDAGAGSALLSLKPLELVTLVEA